MKFYLQYIGSTLGLLLILILDKSYAQTYRAAVVAYMPLRNPNDLPGQIIIHNKEKYDIITERVKDKADIVIFPENGLTTEEINSKPRIHLESYSTVVPDSGIPCNNSNNNVVVGLSCTANSNKIYIVCNVIEKSGNGKDKKLYSTDVVFAPDGRLILKCRKKYIYPGTNIDKGDLNQQCAFDAKFRNSNVKFSLLFDTDMLHERGDSINDVILTSSIKNTLPLSYGLSLQVGYAVRNKVNLLTSGYTDLKAYGGTGIYLKNGTSRVAMSPEEIVSEIPIHENKHDVTNVNIISGNVPPINVPYESIPMLNETNPSVNYTFNDNKNNYCKFEMNLSTNDIKPYKWVAFNGRRQYLGQDISQLVICALIKPEEQKTESKIINTLKISTTLTSSNVNQLLPISLNSNKLPANYQFEEKVDGSLRTATMSLTQGEDLISFGIVVVLKDAIPSSSSSIHAFHICAFGFLPMLLVLWPKDFIISL